MIKKVVLLKLHDHFFRLIQEYADKPEELDINCVDPLNRSALVAAIENENIELIRLLLENNIQVKVSYVICRQIVTI